MSKLDQLRKRIDALDRQMVELLDRRAKLAKQIGEYKKRRGLDYYNPARQKMILGRVLNRGAGEFPRSKRRSGSPTGDLPRRSHTLLP